jgi:uncharacterized protein
MDRPLVVRVADLLRRPGSTSDLALDVVLDGLEGSASAVPAGAPVTVELRLEGLNEGIAATGRVRAPWAGTCRRCLRPVEGEVGADVTEVFEASPVEGETYPLEGDRVDLEPLVREAVLLGLPLAPLCREDCPGLCPVCGADRATVDCGHALDPSDDRWAALSELKFDE